MKMQKIYGFVILSSLLISHLAFAAPEGGVVAAGTADISKSGNTTNINQTSSSAVINWHSFDTAGNETVNFNQPNASSTVLNRINSGLPTHFAGTLNANGKVFIVNPAGMVFAKDSAINAAGLLATTMDVENNDFINGNYKFFSQPGSENSSIINNGNINSSGGRAGFVALIAPNVINGNSGSIVADCGTVVLASGKSFVLDFNQDGLINFDASSVIPNGYIANNGEIVAGGAFGKVFMTTNTVSKVLDNMINTSNITEANAVIKNNNEVILGTITAGSITAQSVTLKADRGISINKNIHNSIDSREPPAIVVVAKTTTGNITIDSYIKARNVYLLAEKGAITESRASTISTSYLNAYSAFGMTFSGKNNVSNFLASNTVSGGIYLRNYGEPITKLGKTYGGYKLEPIGFWEYYFGSNE